MASAAAADPAVVDHASSLLHGSADAGRQASAIPIDAAQQRLIAASTHAVKTSAKKHRTIIRRIVDVFPEISIRHVRKLYKNVSSQFGEDDEGVWADSIVARLINDIAEGPPYPKHAKVESEISRKRKRDADEQHNLAETRDTLYLDRGSEDWSSTYKALCAEFSTVPTLAIRNMMSDEKSITRAYARMAELVDRKGSETKAPTAPSAATCCGGQPWTGSRGSFLALEAARRKWQDQQTALKEQTAAEQAKLDRVRAAELSGDMMECQCCFSDVPSFEMTHCDAEEPHLFCLDCARRNATAQMDLSRYDLRCMDGSRCLASFSRDQRCRFLDEAMITRLERLQQAAELREAGLQDLCECPFCDFAAIYPPVSEDREFRCLSRLCRKVSCRLCRQESHVPFTCEEVRREKGIEERHTIEESMSAALLRQCPKCHLPVIKDGGCNKLTCTRCGTFMCDLCGKNITRGFSAHFGPSGCELYDDSATRNEARIEAARKKAQARIRQENPDISEEDLQIRFSNEVEADAARALAQAPQQYQDLLQLANRNAVPLPRYAQPAPLHAVAPRQPMQNPANVGLAHLHANAAVPMAGANAAIVQAQPRHERQQQSQARQMLPLGLEQQQQHLLQLQTLQRQMDQLHRHLARVQTPQQYEGLQRQIERLRQRKAQCLLQQRAELPPHQQARAEPAAVPAAALVPLPEQAQNANIQPRRGRRSRNAAA